MKRCTVACDTAADVLICSLELPDDASIQCAIQAARVALGDAAVDWDHAAVGVFGKLLSRAYVWQEGDRIELYRPLQIDPRAQRRARAAQAGNKNR